MKSLSQIKEEYKSEAIDNRDLHRLINFIPVEEWEDLGLELKDGVDPSEVDHEVEPFTKENVLKHLESDVAFGFRKALNRRGISAGLMYEVVQMWNWILEDGLEDFDEYPQYGLPLFKATAKKYGFDNPIGEDAGTESKYSTYGG